MSSLAGKTALVTGASRGIGQEIAIHLARQGALVIVHYANSREGAEETLRTIEQAGGRGFLAQADISKPDAIVAMFADIDGELAKRGVDKLDIVVNNAGIGGGGALGLPESLAHVDAELIDRLFATNVRGTFLVTQQAEKRLRDGGRVINISSSVSIAAYPDAIVYAMSKTALNSFTRSLAVDLGKRGITVNAVAPGATNTDFIRPLLEDPELAAFYAKSVTLGRIGEPRDIAEVVTFLASPAGGWITGQLVQATGGQHL